MSLESLTHPATFALSVFIAAALLFDRAAWRDHRAAMAVLMLATAALQPVALLGREFPDLGPLLGVAGLPAMFVLPPAMYFYVRRLTRPGRPENLRRHILAPVLAALAAAPFLALDAETTLAVARSQTIPEPPALLIIGGLASLVMVVAFIPVTTGYLIAAARMASRHDAHIRAHYSDIEGKALGWLRWQIILTLAVWALNGARISIDLTGSTTLAPVHDALKTATDLLGPVWVFALGLMSLRQPAILVAPAPPVADAPRPQLAVETADRILDRLDAAMRDQRLYEKSTLTLRDLATAVGASEHHLSDALNHRRGVTFYDMVNGWRIRAAMEIFEQEPETTALDAMLRVGFNARSTFNAAFRKATGRTPGAWRAGIVRD